MTLQIHKILFHNKIDINNTTNTNNSNNNKILFYYTTIILLLYYSKTIIIVVVTVDLFLFSLFVSLPQQPLHFNDETNTKQGNECSY